MIMEAVALFLWHFVEDKALKEAIAYPISPPGFQRKEYILCGQAEMLKCWNVGSILSLLYIGRKPIWTAQIVEFCIGPHSGL